MHVIKFQRCLCLNLQTPSQCRLVRSYRRFGGVCGLHLKFGLLRAWGCREHVPSKRLQLRQHTQLHSPSVPLWQSPISNTLRTQHIYSKQFCNSEPVTSWSTLSFSDIWFGIRCPLEDYFWNVFTIIDLNFYIHFSHIVHSVFLHGRWNQIHFTAP